MPFTVYIIIPVLSLSLTPSEHTGQLLQEQRRVLQVLCLLEEQHHLPREVQGTLPTLNCEGRLGPRTPTEYNYIIG